MRELRREIPASSTASVDKAQAVVRQTSRRTSRTSAALIDLTGANGAIAARKTLQPATPSVAPGDARTDLQLAVLGSGFDRLVEVVRLRLDRDLL
jgi:hypothetical protein